MFFQVHMYFCIVSSESFHFFPLLHFDLIACEVLGSGGSNGGTSDACTSRLFKFHAFYMGVC